ncbi:MAG TPA: YbhB/YbcL family Raf kinase inhibitor-like protein [Candidatus Dormibacteraeota bacterium]|nr:YbhB/YbcL family Raf kinase inhibitor-like protein [Candidatus Dormibacteraeota bacterium]
MELKSPAYAHGAPIPLEYTCDGKDISPPLSFTGTAPGTRSLALIADDPDAPVGTWIHWVAWNIPAGVGSLPANLPKKAALQDGTRQGMNDFRRAGYGGPCPPSGTHRYFFRLYALDVTLDLPDTTTRKDLDRAMRGHILAEAELLGTCSRR